MKISKDPSILVLTSWSLKEGLIQAYTLPYLSIIQSITGLSTRFFLSTLEKKACALSDKEQQAYKGGLKKKNVFWKPNKYNPFGLRSMINMLRLFINLVILIKREKITVIHAICTPSGMLGYLLSRLTSTPLVIDSLEPHAEKMLQSETWSRYNLRYRLLSYFERKQAEHASHCITATNDDSFYITHYGMNKENSGYKPACVDLDKFMINDQLRNKIRNEYNITNDCIVGIYIGKLGGMYLENEVFDFCKAAISKWGANFRFIILNNQKKKVDELIRDEELDSITFIHEYIDHSEMVGYLNAADFAFCSHKPIPANRYSTPIKNGEYWACGLPIVIPDGISEDSNLVKEHGIGSVLASLTEDSYQESVKVIDKLLQEDKKQLQSRIRKVAEKYRGYYLAEEAYKKAYETE
ncbi:MAG: hypothetical protein AB8B61_03255 [Cyclobacteriaceae bacterium]